MSEGGRFGSKLWSTDSPTLISCQSRLPRTPPSPRPTFPFTLQPNLRLPRPLASLIRSRPRLVDSVETLDESAPIWIFRSIRQRVRSAVARAPTACFSPLPLALARPQRLPEGAVGSLVPRHMMTCLHPRLEQAGSSRPVEHVHPPIRPTLISLPTSMSLLAGPDVSRSVPIGRARSLRPKHPPCPWAMIYLLLLRKRASRLLHPRSLVSFPN